VDLEEIFARLDYLTAWKMAHHRTPGMAIALTDGERTLGVRAYGYANVDAQTPLEPNALLPIGSDGKAFTAIALLQQVEAGRLDVHVPVSRYLPWFEVQSEYAPITAHHLLTHTAGIVAGTEFAADAPYEVYALRYTRAAWPPGERFHYSDVGYKVLGMLLEALTGRPYPEAVRSAVLGPLGMASSEAAVTQAIRHRMAPGYVPVYDDRPPHHMHPMVPAPFVETATGDGCIASTVEDMAVFMRMIINRGRGPNGRVLDEGSFAQMIEPRAEWWPGVGYGYGIASTTARGFLRLSHGGDMPGYNSVWRVDMDSGLGAAVLMNGPLSPGVADFALGLLRAARNGERLTPLSPAPDPHYVENGSDYAGLYSSSHGDMLIAATENGLAIKRESGDVPLEVVSDDLFQAEAPDLDLYLLQFGRDSEGVVTELAHGPNLYTNERYSGRAKYDYPAVWDMYQGHYRAHNPWRSNFRVYVRKGQLLLAWPSGDEEALHPEGGGAFRVGEPDSPELLVFDEALDGRALRARLSTCDYYRFFTP
jgi:D-alanyl-D-alanine carboxypeptidase